MPEAEEVFDLLFYRPIAFFLVKSIYGFPITPNQVTGFSLVAGLIAALFFSMGTATAIVMGALWYAFANILDCADGQLARLQQSGTLLGRVVDGVIDYISSVAIFLGIGVGLASAGYSQWLPVIGAGLSSALHAMFFDHYQGEFISTVRSEGNFLEREIEQFSREIQRMTAEKRDGLKIAALRIYLKYLKLQQRSNTKQNDRAFDPIAYRRENTLMIRMWSVLGPTTNRTLLIVCACLGRIDLFLWIVMIAGNALLVLSYLLQRKIHRRLENLARNEAPPMDAVV